MPFPVCQKLEMDKSENISKYSKVVELYYMCTWKQ